VGGKMARSIRVMENKLEALLVCIKVTNDQETLKSFTNDYAKLNLAYYKRTGKDYVPKK
jgi:hypothetical protein